MLPQFRTMDYAIWRACERFKILPPETETVWSENHPWRQALLLAYDQIRRLEEEEERQHTGIGVLAAVYGKG